MKKAFLSIVTRCCSRPSMLFDNIQSVKAQACQDLEQIFIVDRAKSGLHKANKSLGENKHRVNSQWVLILDDDCWLINTRFVQQLKAFVVENTEAQLVLFKSVRPKGPPSNETVFPAARVWGKTPVHGTTNCLCYAIESSVWKNHIDSFGASAGGDWQLLNQVLQAGHKIFWLDTFSGESRQLGRGKLFEQAGKGWFEKIAKAEGLVNLAKDDWRLQLWKGCKCQQ